MLFRHTGIALLTALAAAGAARSATVEIKGNQLLRDGKPYYIKGAGGTANLDTLLVSGGNSIRAWGPTPAVLDQAEAKGLTVLMGLRVGRPRQGFDYKNRDTVAKQLEDARR